MRKYKDLVDYHISHGYWSSQKDQRYGYVLCPNPFVIKQELAQQLYWMGKSVKLYLEGLKNIFSYAREHTGGHNRLAALLYQICEQAASGLPLHCEERTIPVTKVDCMIDNDGRLWIAEIDAYNPRGIPFALFLRDIFKGVENPFPGVSNVISEKLYHEKELLWIHAEHERYYVPAFQQLQRILGYEGVSVRVQNANEDFYHRDMEKIIMIPWGMRKPKELVQAKKLLGMYDGEPTCFLFPLFPWMGSKAFMGLVSNASENSEIESLMQELVPGYDAIRQYLPPSVLLGKKTSHGNAWCENKTFVLKRNVSSGLKGVWFCNSEHDEFRQAISANRASHIAQTEIYQKQFPVDYFDNRGSVKSEQWYVRLTAYVGANGEILDAEVTGRKTPDVHGALDCIQLPCVLG